MRRLLGPLAALLAISSLTTAATAQPEAAEPPATTAEPPAAAGEGVPAPSETTDTPADTAEPAKPAAPPAEAKPAKPTPPAEEDTPESEEGEERPPVEPPEPRAGTQQPDPVPEPSPQPQSRPRNVDLGPAAGVWWRPASDSGPVSYSAGFAWGATVRTDIERWFGVRATVLSGMVPVTIDPGGIGPSADTRVSQPDVEVIVMSLQAEPTWVVLPRLRLWAGVGIGWGTIVAPAPEALDEPIRSARRAGVLIETSASLGLTVDVVADLITASALLGGALIANQSGEVFEPVQALRQDPPATSIEYFQGLPEFGGTLSGLLSVGLLL